MKGGCASDVYTMIGLRCQNCQRDKAIRDGLDIEDCDDNEVCSLIAKGFQERVPQWVVQPNGDWSCTDYWAVGQEEPRSPCLHTEDMFQEVTE